MKNSLKISNLLKKLWRDLKKVNLEPKQVLKKDSVRRKLKKESSRTEEKSNGKIWREKKNVKSKMKVTLGIKTKYCSWGVVQKWLVFFEKNLNKIANLDQKTCKKKTMKGKLEKDSITSSYKTNKCNLSKVRQFKPCNNSRPRSWLCCCKDSEVIYFKWTMLGFVSEIVFNLFLLFTRKLCFIKFYSTSLAKYRSSRSQMFFKIGALKSFANFTGKQLCWSPFLNNLQTKGLQLC